MEKHVHENSGGISRGGALGAFGCGAWSRLAPWLQERGDVVVALAGGSIGAINAAVVAHHLDEPDWGVGALEQLWREDIATPSCPFFGWSPITSDWGRWLRSWNGFMSGVLVGNRGLYVPHPGRSTRDHRAAAQGVGPAA
jgi:predicted acylesterase/phospholipase RssA